MRLSPGLEKLPPQALEAEQAVLGCCMLDVTNEATTTANEILNPEDFYRNAHGEIFRSIIELFDKREPHDILSVAHHLENRGLLDQCGSRAYLAACLDVPPAVSRCGYYAKKIMEAAGNRKLIEYGCKLIEIGYDLDRQFTDKAAEFSQKLRDLEIHGIDEGPVPIIRAIDESMEDLDPDSPLHGKMKGIPTGFVEIDRKLQGFQAKDLIIVAGRPSMGKTSLGIQFGMACACNSKTPVMVSSLDMGRKAIAERILSMKGSVESSKIRDRKLDYSEFESLKMVRRDLVDAPIFIDQDRRAGIKEIRSRTRKLQREHGVGMLIVDYLQLMRTGGRAEVHRHYVAENVKELKILAGELDIPVIILSQLSRECEKRDNKYPILSDLAESGQTECEADVVMFPFRPDEYKKHENIEERPDVEDAKLIIAKHRNGPTGSIDLKFHKKFAKFVSTEEERDEYESSW